MDRKQPREERRLLDAAIRAFQENTGLKMEEKKLTNAHGERTYDVRLQLGKVNLNAEIKRWAANTNFGALVQQLQTIPDKAILVAEYVNSNMGERLKEHKLQYIDTVGNAYLDLPGNFVYIVGKKPPVIAKKTTDRAFTTQGLRVVFAILCDPDLVGKPYREIAAKADVAVGTIGLVVNDLKAAGFITVLDHKKGRRLRRYRELLDRWTERYPIYLRQKQLLGEFVAHDPLWWKTIKPKKNEFWGGELAAVTYTNYLKPQTADVYLEPEQLGGFLRRIKARKARREEYNAPGRVACYGVFWKHQDGGDGHVHPVLAYADLVATADPRNLEVANIIRNEYITQYFTDD